MSLLVTLATLLVLGRLLAPWSAAPVRRPRGQRISPGPRHVGTSRVLLGVVLAPVPAYA